VLERKHTNLKTFQISDRRVHVNGLMSADEVGLLNVAVQHAYQRDWKPALKGGVVYVSLFSLSLFSLLFFSRLKI